MATSEAPRPQDYITEFQALGQNIKSAETFVRGAVTPGDTAAAVAKISTIRKAINSLMRTVIRDRVLWLQKVQDLEGDVEILKEDIVEVNNQWDTSMRSSAERWKSSTARLVAAQNSLQTKNSALQESNDKLGGELKMLKEDMAVLQAALAEVSLLKDDANEKMEKMEISQRKERKKAKDELAPRGSRTTLETNAPYDRQSVDRRFDAMAAELEAKMEDFKRQNEQEIEGLKTHVKGLKTHVKGLKTRVKGLETSGLEKTQENEGLKTRVKALEMRAYAIDVRHCIRAMEHFLIHSILPGSQGRFTHLGNTREEQITRLQLTHPTIAFTTNHLDLFYKLKDDGNTAAHEHLEVTDIETFMNALVCSFQPSDDDVKRGHDFAVWIDELCSQNGFPFGKFPPPKYKSD